MAATVPPLPSLAEFPEEKEDKELNLKQERKIRFQKSSYSMYRTFYLKKKWLKAISKLSWGEEESGRHPASSLDPTGDILSSG